MIYMYMHCGPHTEPADCKQTNQKAKETNWILRKKERRRTKVENTSSLSWGCTQLSPTQSVEADLANVSFILSFINTIRRSTISTGFSSSDDFDHIDKPRVTENI